MIPDLFPVRGPWPGQLSVMTRPRGGDWLTDEAAGWRRCGISTVVSLLEPEEAAALELGAEGEAARAGGIRFLNLPIPDRGLPPSDSAAIELLQIIVSALESGESVAVHCRQGIGRSPMIVAGALILSGVAPADAMNRVSAARGLAVPETAAQAAWLRALPEAERELIADGMQQTRR